MKSRLTRSLAHAWRKNCGTCVRRQIFVIWMRKGRGRFPRPAGMHSMAFAPIGGPASADGRLILNSLP